jgi:deoxyribonuclease II
MPCTTMSRPTVRARLRLGTPKVRSAVGGASGILIRLFRAGVVGVEGGSELTGFWLVHSTPRFPELPSEYSEYPGMPWNEHIYGQSFLCVSFQGAASLNTVAAALLLNYPDVYDYVLSSSVRSASPGLVQVVQGESNTSPVCDVSVLTSTAGKKFTVFAKSKPWDQDLYADCVAPKLGVKELLVETWIRGYAIGPVCTPSYQVLDVEHVQFDGYSWKETQDHSKWAVDGAGSVTCIGDINRMTSQYRRGGGTVCVEYAPLNQQFLSAVTASNSCATV